MQSNTLIDQRSSFETKKYLLKWLTGQFLSNLQQFRETWTQYFQMLKTGENQGEEMGLVSQMEEVIVGPLAVFIGDSVRSLAACIPLSLPKQWRVSHSIPLSEMQSALGTPQYSGWQQIPTYVVLNIFTEHKPSLGTSMC